MSGYGFALVLAVLTVALLIWLLRTRRIREKFAVLWLVLALLICVLGAFPGLLVWLSDFFGVSTPSNLLLVGALNVLLLVTVQLSVEVSRSEEKSRTLAEHVAILELRVRRLESDGDASVHGPE